MNEKQITLSIKQLAFYSIALVLFSFALGMLVSSSFENYALIAYGLNFLGVLMLVFLAGSRHKESQKQQVR